MLPLILILNLLLAIGCLYVVRWVWRLKKALAIAADALIVAEQTTYEVLHGTPEKIRRGQMGAAELKQRYQRLVPQLQRAQQALALLGLLRSFWWRRSQSLRRAGRRSAAKRR